MLDIMEIKKSVDDKQIVFFVNDGKIFCRWYEDNGEVVCVGIAKIDYIRDGDRWEYRTAGVITYYREITKKCYDKLSAMTYKEREKIIGADLSDVEKWWYGYYGHELADKKKGETNGKYYLGKKIGNSYD